ncbi:MAG: tyrosine-type recombinase/integrase [Clostridia bacterium]|nr:tyrosine-type recombinase/integrase [Clostridia bacterium]MBR1710264.1 tyrosine-type recombinase/integrase [Clostridia bacterium]
MKPKVIDELKNKEFRETLSTFLEWMAQEKYAESSCRGYRNFLYGIDGFMLEKGIDLYSPSVGLKYWEYYTCKHSICKKWSTACLTKVLQLNDFVAGRDYVPLHSNYRPILLPQELEAALTDYIAYCHSCGNKGITTSAKEKRIRKFLKHCFEHGGDCLEHLDAKQVESACIAVENKDEWHVIREFLRFACQTNRIQRDYSVLVPKYNREFVLPTVYTVEEISALLNIIDRKTAVGKRDYAMILLIVRYGMRVGDVVLLSIDNIDFHVGRISYIQLKTNTFQTYELLPDVRAALLDYIENARPDTDENKLFMSTRIPFRPIGTGAVISAVSKYFQSAGIKTEGKKHGPHALRSSLATLMVNDNVPYEQVRKILGHTDPKAIKHYARLDTEKLREFALEVPAPNGQFQLYLQGGVL